MDRTGEERRRDVREEERCKKVEEKRGGKM